MCMPITAHNPFKVRHYPGEVIVLCVRWYLRYLLSCEHVSELVAERGVGASATVKIWDPTYRLAPQPGPTPFFRPTACGYPRGLLGSPPPRKGELHPDKTRLIE